MKNSILFLLGIIAIIGAPSCGGADGVKPDVDVSLPTPNTRYWVGSQIPIAAVLTNNTVIDQYKIKLTLAPPSEALDSALVNGTWEIFGNNTYLFVSPPAYNGTIIQETIDIPQKFTPGNYHLIISALNNQFNEGKDTVPIKIGNQLDTIAPDVVLVFPVDGSSISKGDTLSVTGSVNDVVSDHSSGTMHRIRITLIPQFSGFNPIEIFNSTTAIVTEIEHQYIISNSLQSGSYILRLVAIDTFNNFKQIDLGLSITD